MKKDEVPQEKNRTLGGNRKALYAIDRDGQYKSVPSKGWSVEEIVTSQAVEEFERLADEALDRAKSGKASPLEYFMYKNRMDLPLLSQTTGFFKWSIRRDFKISIFNKMSKKRAKIYSDILGINIKKSKLLC
jgi:hypothetical protein